MLWWGCLALPPSGGRSNLLEPNGSQINDIITHIIMCMYVCMYVCMYQGRVQDGSLQGSLASFRFKGRSHRIARIGSHQGRVASMMMAMMMTAMVTAMMMMIKMMVMMVCPSLPPPSFLLDRSEPRVVLKHLASD